MVPLHSTIRRLVIIFSVVLAASLACTSRQTTTPSNISVPTVALSSPGVGQEVLENEEILITSTSVDDDGIQRIELWVDGVLARVDVNPDVASPYAVQQPWRGTDPGSHVIMVKAFDAQGAEGRSQAVAIKVKPVPTPTSTPETQVMASPEPDLDTPSPTGTPTSRPTWTVAPPLLSPTWTPSPPPATWTPAEPPATWTPAEPAATWTPAEPTATATPAKPTSTWTPSPPPAPACTPPACQEDEVYYCPGVCPGGCGVQCATRVPTVTHPSFEPTGIEPHQALRPVWERPDVRNQVGYPTGAASDDRQFARQYFEHGYLYWWNRPGDTGLIWAVEMPDPAASRGLRWTGPYQDTWDGGDPFSCDAARTSPYGPRSGFGKLWCERPEIAQAVGAARQPEQGSGDSTDYGVVQFFQGGVMLYSPIDREVWVLLNGGVWQRHPE